MKITGKLIAESPIYRGNARKTMFTRDDDGRERLVSLSGEIQGTAQALMDAFIGQSKNGRNIGLLNKLWIRLFDEPLPRGLISEVSCKLNKTSYPSDHFFDLRMGIKLDEDRWASEANANYKMETVLRDSVFDFDMTVSDAAMKNKDDQARLFYLLDELVGGRFWFGAGKSKGLGRLRLELDKPLSAPEAAPPVNPKSNHLRLVLSFDARNPVLVGWNWGKVEPDTPSFAAVEGKVLIGALRDLPPFLAERLRMVLGGPILSPQDWKTKLAQYLPRMTAIWLMEQSKSEVETWSLPDAELAKLGKGKFALSAKLMDRLKPLTEQTFTTREEAEAAVNQAMSQKANMAGRVAKILERSTSAGSDLNRNAWGQIADAFELDDGLAETVAARINDEPELTKALQAACTPVLARYGDLVDRQINLLQSDAWVDQEVAYRQQHLEIKEMILAGKISESQWDDPNQPPKGVAGTAWREFLETHSRVRFSHIANERNLRKSITNDQNMIAFLRTYRNRTRQELAQPQHIDFRPGGRNNAQVSKKYGKPYDTIFMRMLVWKPGQGKDGTWEAYIPGSTIKGAFRKRASQVLKTLWGESRQTDEVLGRLFGVQGQKALINFSDACLASPDNLERNWCSMDGVKMDPGTGQPIESAKSDYLYAYGRDLAFRLQLDLLDMTNADKEALTVLAHLLHDFQVGDVPLGGAKNSGMGWVQAGIEEIDWRTGNPGDIGSWLFQGVAPQRNGLWNQLRLTGQDAQNVFQAVVPTTPLVRKGQSAAARPERARAGFVSHRSFGGFSGRLEVEAEVRTPLHIRESGEPSFATQLPDGPVPGWDCFSLAPPEAALRDADRAYALPAKSLRGLLRHVYAIASDSSQDSSVIAKLNPVDGLFGWVGKGQNQALMGRLSMGFATFASANPCWFKVPFPYGEWQYADGKWTQQAEAKAKTVRVGQKWRLFPNTPLAPLVQQLDGFSPDTAQAVYIRALSPGDKARFTIRFWNLEEEELRRLLWCIQLDADMAHKMGKARYLGFGSLRLRVLPDSFLIDWAARYGQDAGATGRIPLEPGKWQAKDEIKHHGALRKALNADAI